MPSSTSPPASPSAHPPTLTTPGPRATALSNVFHSALSHTLRACSYANFSACFPTPAKYVPQALDGLHREFVGRLETMCKSEFQALMEEREVVASLNELDDLVAEARRRRERGGEESKVVPPHTLPPASLLSAHLAPYLAEQSAAITETLQTTQAENTRLADSISSQRGEIEALLRGLEGVVKDLEEASGTLDAAGEMKGVRGELEGVAGVVVGGR